MSTSISEVWRMSDAEKQDLGIRVRSKGLGVLGNVSIGFVMSFILTLPFMGILGAKSAFLAPVFGVIWLKVTLPLMQRFGWRFIWWDVAPRTQPSEAEDAQGDAKEQRGRLKRFLDFMNER